MSRKTLRCRVLPVRTFGFTLVELLTVTAVVAVLIALLVPAVQQARESARRVACKSNLRQLGLGILNYESVHGVLPPGSQVAPFRGPQPYSKSFGWSVALLPFLERGDLYSQFDFNTDCQIHHRDLTNRIVTVYVCPSDPKGGAPVEWDGDGGETANWGKYFEGGWGGISYLGVSGTDGYVRTDDRTRCAEIASAANDHGIHSGLMFGNSSVRIADITDGTANTFMFGERGITSQLGKWGGAGASGRCPAGLADVVLPGVITSKSIGGIHKPIGDMIDQAHWWSWHPGGTHFGLADGSVRLFSYSTDLTAVAALSTRNDGQVVFAGW